MQAKARGHNPLLAFVPCVYYRQATASFGERYGKLIDGILFPYRAESAGANLKDPTRVAEEIRKIRENMGRKELPMILDVYATGHSRLGASTAEYVREVMKGGREAADGVLIYCHQDKIKGAEKYEVIREVFGEWAGEKSLPLGKDGR